MLGGGGVRWVGWGNEANDLSDLGGAVALYTETYSFASPEIVAHAMCQTKIHIFLLRRQLLNKKIPHNVTLCVEGVKHFFYF